MAKWIDSSDKKGELASVSQDTREVEKLPEILRSEAPGLCIAVAEFRKEVDVWIGNLEQQKELHRKWEKYFERHISPQGRESEAL